MKLYDLIENIFDQNDDLTIWVKSGSSITPESDVVLEHEPEKGEAEAINNGFEYFLEVFETQDLIIGLLGNQKIPKNKVLSVTNRVIEYTENDA
jgi:hypothetical protein